MKRVAYNALLESIKHWEEVVKYPETEAIGPYECALCWEFNSRWNKRFSDNADLISYSVACFGCPVAEKTGKSFCHDTPYEEVERLLGLGHESRPDYRRAAMKELKFLKSLLPKNRRKKKDEDKKKA